MQTCREVGCHDVDETHTICRKDAMRRQSRLSRVLVYGAIRCKYLTAILFPSEYRSTNKSCEGGGVVFMLT